LLTLPLRKNLFVIIIIITSSARLSENGVDGVGGVAAAHAVVAAAAADANATAITDDIATSVANMQPPTPQVVHWQAPPAVLDYLNNPRDADAAMDAAAASTNAADHQDKSSDAKVFTDPIKHHSARIVAHIDLTLDDDGPVITSHEVPKKRSRPARMTANGTAPKKHVNFYTYQTLGAAREALQKGQREKTRRAARNHKRHKPPVIDLTAMEDDDPAAPAADPTSGDSTVDYSQESDDSEVEDVFYIGLTAPIRPRTIARSTILSDKSLTGQR
jgi:hypothetical protein